ncbi:MAG: S-(hydroxymethyl)glutathione dehydrogenase / alcohol dehydrogenase, partial [Streptomyces sp.]|nr:S-(hydroxymethyl)glutathione dehydrogenase / alcohol dehydrogenase [Streptomyces sp.]
MVRAAVLSDVNVPLSVEEIELGELGPGRVRVRLVAAGVCHSDLSLANGTLRQPVPAVLGHEGAGTVVGEEAVMPLPAGVPLADAALLGCAVLTGYGAVHHAARLREGESVAV